MRRFWRWIFNTLAAMSLVLCVATVVAWVRSYWVGDELVCDQHVRRGLCISQGLIMMRGGIELYREADYQLPRHAADAHMQTTFTHLTRTGSQIFYPLYGRTTIAGRLGFGFDREGFTYADVDPQNRSYLSVTAPCYALAILFALLPGWYLLRRQKLKLAYGQERLGLCPTCGYDLRATSDRCPECGMIPEKPLKVLN